MSNLSFWRRRALANHVDMRFRENPVSRTKRAFSSSEGYGKSRWSRNHSFNIRTPLLTNCLDSFCLSTQLTSGADASAWSPYMYVRNVRSECLSPRTSSSSSSVTPCRWPMTGESVSNRDGWRFSPRARLHSRNRATQLEQAVIGFGFAGVVRRMRHWSRCFRQ